MCTWDEKGTQVLEPWLGVSSLECPLPFSRLFFAIFLPMPIARRQAVQRLGCSLGVPQVLWSALELAS